MSKSPDSTFAIPSGRVSFVWGRPTKAPAPWQLGLFCTFRRGKSLLTGASFIPKTGARLYPRVFVFSLQGVLYWMTALALAGYFAGAGVLHARMAADPFNRVRYYDLAAPWRWSAIPELRGRALLDNAKVCYDARRYRDALYLLRAGLARAPADLEARTRLATLYVLFSRRDQADSLFFDGLERGLGDAAYLKSALAFLSDSDRPLRVVEFCRRARVLGTGTGPARSLLDVAEAEALLEIGDPIAAGAVLGETTSEPGVSVWRTRVKAATAVGDFDGAIATARVWTEAQPTDAEAVATLVGVYRGAGRFADMDASLKTLRRLNPSNPDFASMGVLQNLIAGREAEAQAAFDDLVFRFGANPSFLIALANGLGGIGNLGMIARLEEVFREHGFDPQSLWFSRLLVQIDRGEWAAAREVQQALDARKEKLTPAIRVFAQSAGALIDYCSTGAPVAKATVLELLVQHGGRLKLYLRIADAMIAARRWEGARDVLVLAEGAYPQSRRIEERRKRIEPELAALAAATEERFEKERSSSGAPAGPVDAAALFAALEADAAKGDLEEALRRIGAVRRESPPWLAKAGDEVDRRELLLAITADDLPRLKFVAHGYLRDGVAERFERVCELARTARASGQGSVARVLVGEVLRRDPQNVTAAGLLASWKAAEKEDA